jgi:hypothetical protein
MEPGALSKVIGICIVLQRMPANGQEPKNCAIVKEETTRETVQQDRDECVGAKVVFPRIASIHCWGRFAHSCRRRE